MSPTDDQILSCFPETLEEALAEELYVRKLYKKIKEKLNWKSGNSYVDDRTVSRRISKLPENSFHVWQAHPTSKTMIKKYGAKKRYYYRKETTKTQIFGLDRGKIVI